MLLHEFAGGGRDDDRIVALFQFLDALSPERARTRAETECQSPVVWQLLRDRGVIREASPGLYYLDAKRLPLRRRSNLGQTAFITFVAGGILLWIVGMVCGR